ncbi:MAG: histidine triad nucleotide-binding protein [Deltaproteobacteria bacterium]|nr:histidine triad nucleotide-binding protein [Deltaproteobacteria bacterium]
MTADCIFCKIAAGEVGADVLFEDDDILAFRDVRPVAPTHVLVIPRKHITSLAQADPEDQALLGKLLLGVRRVADELGLVEAGYRTIINTGRGAGQTVFHLHVHVMSGRAWTWP